MTREVSSLANEAWEMSRAGDYEKAIELYSVCFERDGKASHLFGRATSKFEKGNYPSALEDLQYLVRYVEPEFLVDDYYIFQGLCYWYLEEPSQVIPIWEQGLTAPYTDAAGGVILPSLILYASTRINDAEASNLALRLLKKHARRSLRGWPGPVVPFLLGKIDTAALESHVNVTSNQTLRFRWQCQADFYIGLRAYRSGDRALFEDAMYRCSQNPRGYFEAEYFLARWEVKEGFPDPAFSAQP